MGEHTQGKWEHSGNQIVSGAQEICEMEACYRQGERKANAARIVSCVNACEGMDDPAKDIAALRAENAKLRDAAHEALNEILACVVDGTFPQSTVTHPTVERLRAALQKRE